MKAVLGVCALLMLGGCATEGQSNPPWLALTDSSCAKLSGDQELSMNLADDMAKEGKLHASLANLQSLPERYAQVQLRKDGSTVSWVALKPGPYTVGCSAPA